MVARLFVWYQRSAHRFDLGNYNFLAATLVSNTLKLLNGLGTEAIDRHVTSLATELSSRLVDMGTPVRAPASGRRANIVCIESRRGPGPAQELQQHLKASNVRTALRRNVVRFSFHLYNNLSDVQAAQRACETWLERHGPSLR